MTEWVLTQAADYILPPKVHEITSQDVFARECLGEGAGNSPRLLCVVAFLPQIYNSSAMARNMALESLGEVAKRFVAWDIAYFWAQAGDHRCVARGGTRGWGSVHVAACDRVRCPSAPVPSRAR